MDDPWGSPWATAEGDRELKPGSPAKSDIVPPPRAFLPASSSPRVPAIVEQSPWGGDDVGFGEWTTASDAATHSVWAAPWGGSSPNLPATPRDDLLGKSSPITLPGSIATPGPANGSRLRQPSPDPWGSGFSSHRSSHDAVTTPRLVVESASPADSPIDTLKENPFGIREEAVWDKFETKTEEFTAAQTTTIPEPTAATRDPTEGEGVEDYETTPASVSGDDARLSVESNRQTRGDRSSTPSNENTDHEGERPDSPITSVDEEQRSSRFSTRKLSGKVQELVVKFDGLARAASEEHPPIARTRSISPSVSSKKDGREDDPRDAVDDADFGESEDADAVADGDTDERAMEPPSQPEQPAPNQHRREHSGANDASTALLPPLPDSPSPIAKFGPLDFHVDLELVTKLFPPTAAELSHEAKVDREVLDHVINDSFTEISQRKTWYRISRLGSTRRHDAGDDESYRRVAWPSSTVHDETIKIVRRWMEEDSIAGRIALGGRVSKTQKNMFGWDSSAEPVALDAVFKKKSSHTRAALSQPPPASTLSLELADASATHSPQRPTHRASGSVGPAVPSFGWNTGSLAPSSQTSTTGMIPEPPNATASAPAPTTSQTADEDDDDEWGEMVSSPVTSQPTTAGPVVQELGAVGIFSQTGGPAPTPSDAAAPSVTELPPAKPAPQGQASTINSKFVEHPGGSLGSEGSAAQSLESTTTHDLSQRPPPPEAGQPPNADLQIAHERMAEQILASLPDLSYMLR
ncbi:hypothetical protein MYCTH_2301714 [Thermothelomyces thermophilus ATCC 42464]|uniref:Uncharacterized protein n=1 Tax=Thermothelomyces thermophilus (strain ATCC 42464 / BCRC 31852 / DSM 1799) TaxID=573729 RepID=G2QA07_THET4|nr:uncharacterized protein MYCTH_2301714 [Thermothelomyces thermophilus ATCC 42464]AEO56611.1 hypothetical protein MYCTH_2301714 [Thermothelomyces thermophilus ATCC 42464]